MGFFNDLWDDVKSAAQDVWDHPLNLFLVPSASILVPALLLYDMARLGVKSLIPDIPDMRRDREQMIVSATSPRRIVYGKTRVSGTLVYAETSGSKNEFLNLIVVFTGHEIDSYQEIYFNDIKIATVSGGVLTYQSDWGSFAAIYMYDGTQTDACANMISHSAGGWTSAHKLLGCAYTYFRLTYDENHFASGIPNIKVVMKGKKIYDPRSGVTAWSDNPALCIRDYMLLSNGNGGMGCSPAEIHAASFTAAANTCDATITIPGGTEKRYTLNGVVTLDGTPSSFIVSMLTSMAGQALYSEGVWKLYAGETFSSVATLDESWLNGGISFKTASSKNDRANNITGTFTNPDDSYSDTAFPPVPAGVGAPPNAAYWGFVASPSYYVASNTYSAGDYVVVSLQVYQANTSVPINTAPPNATYWTLMENYDSGTGYPSIGHKVQRAAVVYTSIAAVPVANDYLNEDGELLSKSITLPFTTSQTTAQRLATVQLNATRFGMTVAYPCNYKAAVLNAMDTVHVNNTQLGWSGKQFRIVSWEFAPSGGITLSLMEDDPAIFNDPGTYSVIHPAALSNLPNPRIVAAPTGLTATEVLYATVTVASYKSRLDLAWTSADAAGLIYDVMFAGNVIQNITATTYSIYDLSPGTYSISVRARNALNAVSAWTTISKVVGGQASPPATPTGFTATQLPTGQIELKWNANTEVDIDCYIIKSGLTWSFGTMIVDRFKGTRMVIQPGVTGATSYLIKAVDTSGNESTAAASATLTITAVAVDNSLLAGDIATAATTATVNTDGTLKGSGGVLVDNGKIIAIDQTTGNLKSNTVDAAQLVSNSVTAVKIASGAVTATKTNIAAIDAATGNLVAGSVDAAQLVTNAVTAVKIASGAVTAAKTTIAAIDSTSGNLVANSVTATQIVAGSITSSHIATDTITASNIAAGAIGASEIAAGAVTAGKIAAGSITSTEIAAGTITAGNIAAGAITASDITTGTLNVGVITSGSIVNPQGSFSAGSLTNPASGTVIATVNITVAGGRPVLVAMTFELICATATVVGSSLATNYIPFRLERVSGGTATTIYDANSTFLCSQDVTIIKLDTTTLSAGTYTYRAVTTASWIGSAQNRTIRAIEFIQ